MKKITFLIILIISNLCHAQLKQPAIILDTTTQDLSFGHDITMFPSIQGFKKQAIFVPKDALESGLKIEVLAAKKTEIDNCNQYQLIGTFEKKILENYGYTYFLFNSNSLVISTKMACEHSQIQLNYVYSTKREMTEYRSSQPIVAYAPEGIKIFYRVWRQDNKLSEALMYE